MKDPWQHEPSAYELLGVSELVTDSEVDRAFKLAMGRVTPQQAIQARNALRRPEERALLNLFRYDQRSLELAPFPLAPEYLSDIASRRKVAQALIAAEKSEPMLAHTVAVLHYWWAKSVPIVTDGIPPHRTPWGIALSHFIFLLNHPDLKYQWFDPEVDPDMVRSAAIERLRSELQAEHIRYRESGDLPSCLAIDEMQRHFEVELIAAANELDYLLVHFGGD